MQSSKETTSRSIRRFLGAIIRTSAVFVVSWTTGSQMAKIPCEGKEAPDVICAHAVEVRSEKAFKTHDAAAEFMDAMNSVKAANVRMEDRKGK
jgi:hypothetical protein